MAGRRLIVHPPAATPSPEWANATADKDGYFAAPKLKPGSYLVRIMPQRAALEVVPQFSADDLKIVDQDLQTSEWPGGREEQSATPVPVNPGGSVSVGTITVRKALYYRAHVSVLPADCQPGEKWSFAAMQPASAETRSFRLWTFLARKSFWFATSAPVPTCSLSPADATWRPTSGRMPPWK
jgi:hypothetical protein